MLGNVIPLAQLHDVIDAFLEKGFPSLNNIVITMLIKLKPILLNSYDNQLLTALSMQRLTR